MSVELISLLFILAAFSLYGVLSGVELGVAVLRIEPRLAPAAISKKVFTPRLEMTNVLLALGCAGMALLFKDAAAKVFEAAWPALLVGILALIVRAGLLVYLVMHKTRTGDRALNYIFAAVSFVVPVSLGSAGIYMVTGAPFWGSSVGFTLFITLLVGLAALGAGFMYYIGGKQAPQGVVVVSRVLNLALACLLAIVLLGVLSGGGSHLFNLSYAYLAIIAAGIIMMQSIFLAAGKEWRMWWCLAGLAVLAPFLVGLANYPYLIFPDVMVAAARAI